MLTLKYIIQIYINIITYKGLNKFDIVLYK